MTAPRTLLDVWVPSDMDKNLFPIAFKAFAEKRFDARKFVFTDEVAEMMAGLMKDHPNLLLDNMQFALPPYQATYIEFPINTFLEGLGKRRSHEDWQTYGMDATKDYTTGYLIVGRSVYVLVKTDDGRIGLSPMVYKLYFETVEEALSFKGIRPFYWRTEEPTGDEFIDGIVATKLFSPETTHWNLTQMLGSTIQNPKLDLTQEQADFLAMNYVCVDKAAEEFVKNKATHKDQTMRAFLEGSMGEIRNILLCLLWLNQPRLVDIVHVPATRGWVGNKTRAFSSYHTVSLKQHVTIRRALGVFREHSKHRRHEVQAYFRNFDKHPGCSHEWPLYPDADGKWTCPICGQWRVRVKEHLRGDASIGFVSKDYKVDR